MKFKSLEIVNFRNFDNVKVELSNRNVIFGLNDIGKTNFLQAIRFLLDKDIRKNGFIESDFHKHQIHKNIEITLELDISDFTESEDTKKLIAKIDEAGVRNSNNADRFFIKLVSEFNKAEMVGEFKLLWGDDINKLKEVQGNLYSSKVDSIFKVVYVDPAVDLDKVFEKNRKILTNEFENSSEDKEIVENINKLTQEVNNQIGAMSKIQELQRALTAEYLEIKNENIEIEMKSEMVINGFFSDITPYIKMPNEDRYYPTSGDGRKKLLIYSLLNLINKRKFSDKIVIYLLEEPENSLHRSTQIGISKQIFGEAYEYSFISTHSSDIIYSANNVQFIRIYSDKKLECSSYLYKIHENINKQKKKLNRDICNAIFAKRVLLVEGPSEQLLFEKVMEEVNYDYEAEGGYILCVNGIYFKEYYKVFKGLGIDVIVKTDNDIKKKNLKSEKESNSKTYELLGINRCLKLLDDTELEDIILSKDITDLDKKVVRREQFVKHKTIVTKLECNKIFLSELDLENDLANVISNKLMTFTDKKTLEEAIKKLQEKKRYNMVAFIDELEKDDCEKIYNDEKFKCLKELNNDTENIEK